MINIKISCQCQKVPYNFLICLEVIRICIYRHRIRGVLSENDKLQYTVLYYMYNRKMSDSNSNVCHLFLIFLAVTLCRS